MRHNDAWLEGRRNDAARLVRVSNRERNSIRFSSNETLQHLLLKAHICYELAQAGHDYITEARFENGGRCDVLDLDDHVCVECLSTESEPQVILKTSTYPPSLSIEFAKFNGDKIERGILKCSK